MTLEEKEKRLADLSRPILKSIKELYLDKVEKKIDEDDGEVFWTKKGFIPGSDIDRGERLLNEVAALYRNAGIRNNNPGYRKYSRLVAHIRMDFLPKSLTEMLEELEEHLVNDRLFDSPT